MWIMASEDGGFRKQAESMNARVIISPYVKSDVEKSVLKHEFRFVFLNALQVAKMAVYFLIGIFPDRTGVINDNICIFFFINFLITDLFHNSRHSLRLKGIHLTACILNKKGWSLCIFFPDQF